MFVGEKGGLASRRAQPSGLVVHRHTMVPAAEREEVARFAAIAGVYSLEVVPVSNPKFRKPNAWQRHSRDAEMRECLRMDLFPDFNGYCS